MLVGENNAPARGVAVEGGETATSIDMNVGSESGDHRKRRPDRGERHPHPRLAPSAPSSRALGAAFTPRRSTNARTRSRVSDDVSERRLARKPRCARHERDEPHPRARLRSPEAARVTLRLPDPVGASATSSTAVVDALFGMTHRRSRIPLFGRATGCVADLGGARADPWARERLHVPKC